MPELHRDELRGASFAAGAGCYATAALLPLVPFLRAGLVEPGPVIVDAKSGVSGAGRTLEDKYLFAELDGNVRGLQGGEPSPRGRRSSRRRRSPPAGRSASPSCRSSCR